MKNKTVESIPGKGSSFRLKLQGEIIQANMVWKIVIGLFNTNQDGRNQKPIVEVM